MQNDHSLTIHPLPQLLELMAVADRQKWMPRWSFPHTLGAKHWQQDPEAGGGGGYSEVAGDDEALDFTYSVPARLCEARGGTALRAAVVAAGGARALLDGDDDDR